MTSIQLHASHDTWHRRFEAGPDRPDVSEFYRNTYEQAQTTQPIMLWTPTDGLTPIDIAHRGDRRHSAP